MGGQPGGEWRPAGVRLSPFTVHLKLSQHCGSVTLQYKIKFKKNNHKTNQNNDANALKLSLFL